MTEEQIEKDRKERVAKAKDEIEKILSKYELALTANDVIGLHTKINVEIQFMDMKKYDAKIAQEDKKIMEDLLDPKGDKITK